ncbi:MAG TPA: hypothetical protein VGX28_03080 [Frankiaceae bacterium]|nr:hypothetical protein [Frankiaceae bacterium]
MNTEAWCGHCGESFRLAQVVEEGVGGRCPRCGIVFSHEYNAVVTSAVSAAIEAHQQLQDALQRIGEMAPLLHVDRDALVKSLDLHLQR